MKKQITIEEVEIDDILFDPKNANIGTERGAHVVEQSIRDFGYLEAGTLDKDNMLIGGNKRTKAAAEVGMENAMIIDVEGDTAVYIRRKDLDLDSNDADTREKTRKAAYMLNRAGQLSLKWDAVQLEDDIASGLDLSNMFDEDELKEIIVKAKAIPNTSDQVEPTLVSEHCIQIFCSSSDLDAFMPHLNEWMERSSVTINIA